ncbi:MAG: hypothetical protein ACREIF_14510 [Chthoniobacterales bacterium]
MKTRFVCPLFQKIEQRPKLRGDRKFPTRVSAQMRGIGGSAPR